MYFPRFTLRSLLAGVTFCGIALASLLQPWRNWCPSVVFSATLFLLLVAVPAIIYARDQSRAYYVGFAAIGWGYFVLAYSPWLETTAGRQLLAYPAAESLCFSVTGSLGDFPHFLKVTHSLSLFVFAQLGGVVMSQFYKSSQSYRPTERGSLSHRFKERQSPRTNGNLHNISQFTEAERREPPGDLRVQRKARGLLI